MLKVWLLNTSEQLAYTGSKRRRMRTGLLARALIERGHDVTWWKSTFEHVSKSHYRMGNSFEKVEPGLTIGWIHSLGYRKHISLSRFIDHVQVGSKFGMLAKKRSAPDAIVCSLPTPELAFSGTQYGLKNGVPVVIDIRDWWPEALIYSLPSKYKLIADFLAHPYDMLVSKVCRSASVITGITDDFVEWGLARANRDYGKLDKTFTHGYEIPNISYEARADAREYWDSMGVAKKKDGFVVTFIGSMTRTFDFSHIIEAAGKLSAAGESVQFVFCGRGDRMEETRRQAAGIDEIVFTGEWVNTARIQELLSRTAVGIVPLPLRPDFLATVNNKTIEYLSAGVPIIVSPPESRVAALVDRESCGAVYNGIDGKQLYDTIKRFKNDRSLLDDISKRAKQLYINKYTANKVYDAFASHIEKIEKEFSLKDMV